MMELYTGVGCAGGLHPRLCLVQVAAEANLEGRRRRRRGGGEAAATAAATRSALATPERRVAPIYIVYMHGTIAPRPQAKILAVLSL